MTFVFQKSSVVSSLSLVTGVNFCPPQREVGNLRGETVAGINFRLAALLFNVLCCCQDCTYTFLYI